MLKKDISEKDYKKSIFYSIVLFAVGILLFSGCVAGIVLAQDYQNIDDFIIKNNDQLNEMNQEIESKKKQSEDLGKKIQDYKDRISQLEGKVVDLQSQMLILDNQVKKTELEMTDIQVQIDRTTLEITSTNLKIEDEKAQIDDQKEKMITLLREIYHNDNRSYLEMLIMNNSFSEFFDQIKYLGDVQSALQSSLDTVIAYKESLDKEKLALESSKEALDKLKTDLEDKQQALEETQTARSQILDQTVQNQQNYENLMFSARQEQEQINLDMARSEAKFRKLLEQKKSSGEVSTSSGLAWPVPNQGIAAYFHDPDYPYRYIFEHPAIDIRTLINGKSSSGLRVRAAADGYVGKAHDGGMGYSYILLVHDNGLSTVYGHVSAIYVSEGQYVKQGDIIGLSGGAPGTPGAGKLTTGPHLHFEVRLNGIPVDPLDYLP